VNIHDDAMGAHKTFRQGQILKVVANEAITSQDELRRRLAHLGMKVTQATLSRDLHDLGLVKTIDGYKPLTAAAPDEGHGGRQLIRALREFLLDVRPAHNLLVLKTPPGGAQPLGAAVDAERWKEVAGTIAGDDTVLVVTTSPRARHGVQRRIEDLLK
jgi:transcriptional regulator of arginine metabolism